VKFVWVGNFLILKNLIKKNITSMHQQILKWENVKKKKKKKTLKYHNCYKQIN